MAIRVTYSLPGAKKDVCAELDLTRDQWRNMNYRQQVCVLEWVAGETYEYGVFQVSVEESNDPT